VELLEKVLRLGEAEAGDEVLPEDADAIRLGGGAGKAKRTTGSMLALSGARGAYLEYSTGANAGESGARGRGVAKTQAPRPIKPRNAILRERDAARMRK
jgi:DNA excision repair protein ERCC-3